MTDIAALIKRIESGASPSGQLDQDIEIAMGDRTILGRPPLYSRLIDAALRLVPEGTMFHVGRYAKDCRASISFGYSPDDNFMDCTGSTPALAICHAALRARKDGRL